MDNIFVDVLKGLEQMLMQLGSDWVTYTMNMCRREEEEIHASDSRRRNSSSCTHGNCVEVQVGNDGTSELNDTTVPFVNEEHVAYDGRSAETRHCIVACSCVVPSTTHKGILTCASGPVHACIS